MARLAAVRRIDAKLPDFGVPAERSGQPRGRCAARLDRPRQRVAEAGLAALVIFADREHFANVTSTRIEGRRAFMADVPGICLKPEVLPFSNVQGRFPPFLLEPGRALALR